MRVRRCWVRRFALAGVLGVAVPFAAMTAPPAGAKPPPGLPPGLRPTEVDVSSDLVRRWGEPDVAVNPTDPNNLVYSTTSSGFTYACKASGDPNCELVSRAPLAGLGPRGLFEEPGFTAVHVFVSFDRGRTWQRVDLPVAPSGHPDLTLAGHETLTVGPDGTFYLAWNTLRWTQSATGALVHGGIAATKSTDGGLTWSDPVLTGTPLDHPRTTVDLSTGVVYGASTGTLGPTSTGDPNAPVGPNDRWLVSSTDGVHWSNPRPFGGGVAGGNFRIPFISAANGMLAGVFRSTSPARCGAAPACIVFQATTDAGATWSANLVPAPTGSALGPMVAADPSTAGHFAVAVLNDTDTQLLVYQTFDSGNTWSGPTAVTEDPTKTHAKPWIAYSPEGVLGLMWKTNEPGPGPTFAFNVWAAISEDGGSTFSPPLKISRATSQAPDPGTYGDSSDSGSHIALSRQGAFVAWGDWRPGDDAVFFSAVKLQAFNHPRR